MLFTTSAHCRSNGLNPQTLALWRRERTDTSPHNAHQQASDAHQGDPTEDSFSKKWLDMTLGNDGPADDLTTMLGTDICFFKERVGATSTTDASNDDINGSARQQSGKLLILQPATFFQPCCSHRFAQFASAHQTLHLALMNSEKKKPTNASFCEKCLDTMMLRMTDFWSRPSCGQFAHLVQKVRFVDICNVEERVGTTSTHNIDTVPLLTTWTHG